jgi:surface carbohydrate biosynthesis protein
MRRILLIVPRPVRDLPGHALVASHLRKRYGHEVRLYYGSDTTEALFESAPDALVLDCVGWEDRAAQARLAHRLGVRVVVLPTSGVYAEPASLARLAGLSNGANQVVNRYLAWGEYSRNAIVESGALSSERVVLTGCPRFDFYAAPYRAFLPPRADCDGAIVWATGTNNYNCGSSMMCRHLLRRVASNGNSDAEFRTQLEDERTQFEEHSRVVMELARRRPEWRFGVKVHPLEDRRPYCRLAASAPNIKLLPNVPITEVLPGVAVLLQRGCTTATEAWILGEPVLELMMGRFHMQWATTEHGLGNEAVSTVDEAEAAIARYLDGAPVAEPQQRARAAYITRHYRAIDGCSSALCAAAINACISAPEYSDADHQCTRRALAEARQVWGERESRRLRNRVKTALRIPRGQPLRFWRRPAPPLDDGAVTELFRQYESVL